jgi:hypothetical protein
MRIAGWIGGIALVVSLVGCNRDPSAALERVGPEVQVGNGVGLAGPWTAWLYRTTDDLTCLMIRDVHGRDIGGCDGGSAIGPDVSGDGFNSTTVSGGTARADAVSARVTLVGNRQVTLDLVLPGAGVSDGFRYYVGVFPGTAVVHSVEILDGAGGVIEAHPDLN